ncbi:MAG: Hpt domain-containing protein, partial [Anaerolineae bacterium]|nr:Hpt domain-containing protein [Anaerolineae bacterium]
MADSDTDLLTIFKDEVGEYLALLNKALLRIETSTADVELLRELNRIAHSMKGAARAVGIKPVETVSHAMESVFEAARNEQIELSPSVCDLIYDGLDIIHLIVEGQDIEAETLGLIISSLESLTPVDEKPASSRIRDTFSMEIPVVRLEEPANEPATLTLRAAEDSVRVTVSKLDRLMAEVSELLVARMQNEERLHEIELLRRLHARWRREWQGVRGAYVRLARRMQDEDGDLKEDLAALFKFLESNQRYLGDSNHQLGQLAHIVGQDNLRLSTLSDQLQDDITRMRLISFETLLSTFQRMVRDLARDTGKQVHFDVMGASVEIDKTVLDALKDPIIHLLRNAVDHGIEPPDVRERRGKSPVGVIRLMIEQRGSEVMVRVADDGTGIDSRAVLETAVMVGVLNEQDAETLSEEDARDLIFQPGLTTSSHLTTISGRGIGMDAVRSQVERMRGRVS